MSLIAEGMLGSNSISWPFLLTYPEAMGVGSRGRGGPCSPWIFIANIVDRGLKVLFFGLFLLFFGIFCKFSVFFSIGFPLEHFLPTLLPEANLTL